MISAFQEFAKSQYNIDIEMSQISAKENFNEVSIMANILSWQKSETAQGTNYQLIEGRALRTYWHIVWNGATYVVYFKTTPIKAMSSLESAKSACEQIFNILY